MLVLGILCLVGVAVAGPPVGRTREHIEAFRNYLEGSRTENGIRLEDRMAQNPQGKTWENSGKYQGDILLDDEQVEAMVEDFAAGRNAYTWPNTKWPQNTIIYEFASGFKNGIRLEDRMAQNPQGKAWENSGKYQGDILLDDEQVEAMVEDFAAGRNAYTWPNTKWPQNTIIYEFASGFTNAQRNAILAGIRDIEQNTCIRFRLRTSSDRNYVLLTNRPDGCYANVGYWSTRGVHTLNLAWNCYLHTTIVHEWIHIIGFLHMQSTHNRDDYVRIMWENIMPGMEHNFDKYPANLVSNLELPYDYASCMHYGGYGFSVNGRPTMVALFDRENIMGQEEFVSDLDWLRINRHYDCPGAWN